MKESRLVTWRVGVREPEQPHLLGKAGAEGMWPRAGTLHLRRLCPPGCAAFALRGQTVWTGDSRLPYPVFTL